MTTIFAQMSRLTVALVIAVSIHEGHLHSAVDQIAQNSEAFAPHKVTGIDERRGYSD